MSTVAFDEVKPPTVLEMYQALHKIEQLEEKILTLQAELATESYRRIRMLAERDRERELALMWERRAKSHGCVDGGDDDCG